MSKGGVYREALERCRRRMLRWGLRTCHGHVVLAAKKLGLDRTAMHVMLKRHGIDPSAFRTPREKTP